MNMADETITQLLQQYDAATTEIQDLEARLEAVKGRRSGVAKTIKDTFGAGPHDKDGKKVIVTHKGETHFLKGAK